MGAALFSSIVPIVSVEEPRDEPVLIGTGIVISPVTVITCRHLIENSRTESAQFNNRAGERPKTKDERHIL